MLGDDSCIADITVVEATHRFRDEEPAPRVYVCTGKRCRKRAKARTAALAALGPGVSVVEVGCQKICEGPVVGTKVDGRLEWFERVDSDKSRSALARLVEGAELKKPLLKRHVPKRSGRIR